MERLRRSLTSGSLAACGRPGIVTVARAAVDPYAPPGRANWLQDQVVELVTEIYGPVEVELDLEYEGDVGDGGAAPVKRGSEVQPPAESKRPRTSGTGTGAIEGHFEGAAAQEGGSAR